jgi:hypothetical protein
MRAALVGFLVLASVAQADEQLTDSQAKELNKAIDAYAANFALRLVDLDLLVQQNAGKFVESTNEKGERIRELDLGDGQSIHCVGDECLGIDPYDGGQCLMKRLTVIRIGVEACDFVLDDPSKKVIEYQKKLMVHFASSALPKRDPETLEAEFQTVVEAYRHVLKAPYFEERIDCRELSSPTSGLQTYRLEFFEAISDPAAAEMFERYLAKPRLPLWTYCTETSHEDFFDPSSGYPLYPWLE